MAHNLNLLDGMVTFVEVVKCGSFTKAAQNSSRTTSFISKEISKLEQRLGIRLLNRTTRALSLTPEGELYYQQAQQLILDAEQVESVVSGGQQEPSGTLKLNCPVSLGISQLRPILSDYLRLNPKVTLELELNDRRVDMIDEGYDVLVRATATLPEDSSLIYRQVQTAYSLTLAAPSYLREYGTPLHPEELKHHKTLAYSNLERPKLWEFESHNGDKTSVQVEGQILSNSAQMELAFCLAGNGIVRLPSFVITDEIKNGDLVEVLPDYKRHKIGIYLVYPSRKHMSLKVRSFIDFVLERTAG